MLFKKGNSLIFFIKFNEPYIRFIIILNMVVLNTYTNTRYFLFLIMKNYKVKCTPKHGQ